MSISSFRKQFYGINFMIIGDPRHRIRAADARWAGATHDARVWSTSDAKTIFERQEEFTLIGDSAYPVR